MANSFQQETRIGELKTPLGKDVLVLTRFDGAEGLSELFEYRIEALSEKENIDFDSVIGKHCTLQMNAIGGGKRYFDGILTEAQWMGVHDGGYVYRLVLRPWLWLLSHRRNALIFHDKTAPEIISQIFQEHGGLADFEQRLTKSYPTLEYCVQYRESDMAFVCRLMERHGISFMFVHQDGAHKLVMIDAASSADTIPGGSRKYYPLSGQYRRDHEHFYHWMPERRLTSGKVALNDYDFKKPSANLKSEKTGDAKYEHGKLEVYDYPGDYVVQGDGNNYAQSRLDMERGGDGRFLASGDCVTCYPGALVELKNHPDKTQNREYLAMRCVHSYLAESYSSGATADSSETYQGNFEFMRSDKPFAPPIITERPFVHGPQTAKVVGPQGEEIHCDEHGRIRVRFHWDRKSDQSMWCRLAQVWSGKNWGGIFIPRIGMEVIVEFLEGDPDRPIVIGCVYNGENKPPFELPDKKNINGWKSNSTLGGGGYNELVFDDTKGDELIRIHAQYDLDTTVLNDERRLVGVNRTTEIGNNEKLTVGNNREWTIGNNETHEVGNNRSTSIGNNDRLVVGNELFIKAGSKITLTVGASTIVMDSMSISITSPTVKINASMEFKSSAGITSTHTAGAMMDIKGALVKINT